MHFYAVITTYLLPYIIVYKTNDNNIAVLHDLQEIDCVQLLSTHIRTDIPQNDDGVIKCIQ